MYERQIKKINEAEKQKEGALLEIADFLNNQFKELSIHNIYCVNSNGDKVEVNFFVDEDGLNIELSRN